MQEATPVPHDAPLILARDGPALARARAHEAAGPARRGFAALAAGAARGPVLWVLGDADAGRPHPDGLARFVHPGRLTLVEAARGADALWAAEEALRAGAAPVVVVEPPTPPALTPVRRLNLAAEAGAEAAAGQRLPPPLCLILTPEGGTAAAVQTRWWIDPLPAWPHAAARWRARLLRDKAGPPATWAIALAADAPRPDAVRLSA